MGKGTILGWIHSKPPTKEYEETWERVFGKKDKPEESPEKEEKSTRDYSHF